MQKGAYAISDVHASTILDRDVIIRVVNVVESFSQVELGSGHAWAKVSGTEPRFVEVLLVTRHTAYCCKLKDLCAYDMSDFTGSWIGVYF